MKKEMRAASALFALGHRVMRGGTRDPASGKTVINRLTWSAQADGKVRQHWEISADGGKTWPTAFNRLYEKK